MEYEKTINELRDMLNARCDRALAEYKADRSLGNFTALCQTTRDAIDTFSGQVRAVNAATYAAERLRFFQEVING